MPIVIPTICRYNLNCMFRIFDLTTCRVYVSPLDLRELIVLLSDFCCLTSVKNRLFAF